MASFFSKMFKDSDKNESALSNANSFTWNELKDGMSLELIKEQSNERPQLIFKHSTSCGISGMVIRKFEQQHAQAQERIQFYKLDLLQNRALSNEIATYFQVPHQSPQIILVSEGKVSVHSSHYEILQSQLSAS